MSDRSSAFAAFMSSATGRLVRIIAGIGLGTCGWTMRGTTVGVVLMTVGVVPILAGAMNVILIAPLIGAPFWGSAARPRASGRQQ